MFDAKPFCARQPGKAIWTGLVLVSCVVRVPFIFIYFIPEALRPHPHWTYRQAVTNEITKFYFKYAGTIEKNTVRLMEPGADKERFVVMRPAEQAMYRGILDEKHILPEAIGGIWLPGPYNANTDRHKRVVLHFHGGAYVMLSPRDPNVQWGPMKMGKELPAMVLCPQYRLASNPNGRFPAALQDALTSYHYLLDLGITASQIILSGDSAGAHLAISLLRYLVSTEAPLPPPSAALLWSPWTNLAATAQDVDRHRNSKSDYITSVWLQWGKRCFVPSTLPITHPYISPLSHPFASRTPIWIQVGQAEILYDQGVQFMKNMGAISSNRIGLHEIPRAPHDTFAAGGSLGFERESTEALAAARQFLQAHGAIS